MTLKDLVEKYGTGDTLREKIATALQYIFNFEFPMYDNAYKTVLETKIVKHYLARELCFDDEERWNLALDTWLNENMPLYNQRYQSTLITIMPLVNQKLETQHSGSGAQTQTLHDTSTKSGTQSGSDTHNIQSERSHGDTLQSEGTITRHSDDTKKQSDTPLGSIESLDDYLARAEVDHHEDGEGNAKQDIQTGQEESQTTDGLTFSHTVSETATDTKSNSFTDTNSYLQNLVGHTGISQSKLLEEYRETFINIDKEIITGMGTLFSSYVSNNPSVNIYIA